MIPVFHGFLDSFATDPLRYNCGPSSEGSNTKRLDYKPSHRRSEKLLLPRFSVADGMRFETAGDNEICLLQLFGLLFNPESLDTLADIGIGECLV
jgi:hypothetical protein